MKPASPVLRPACSLLTAGLVLSWASILHSEGLSSDSPFLNTADSAAPQAAPTDFQLAGISAIGGDTSVCIVESVRKKSTWMKVGSSDKDLEIISCSLASNQAVLRIHGELRTLTLRTPTKVAGARPSQPVAASLVPQLRPALPQNAPAPEAAPPDIGPAGGQLPPVLPLTTREEQEREARMLVSDLMEIGMRQRKAYEEAQRAAKAEAANSGANAAPQPATKTTP